MRARRVASNSRRLERHRPLRSDDEAKLFGVGGRAGPAHRAVYRTHDPPVNNIMISIISNVITASIKTILLRGRHARRLAAVEEAAAWPRAARTARPLQAVGEHLGMAELVELIGDG